MKKYFDYVNILVIPTDYCNMRCRYCFHNEFHDTESSKFQMSVSTLEQLMKITIPNYKKVSFIWHGGEPLLRGVDYYQKAVELQREYSTSTVVSNSIQTNLTLMNQEYIDFFKRNSFGIGSSYDGITNEVTRGYSDEILENWQLLKSNDVRCGFICVVSNANVKELIPIYEDFKRRGIGFTLNRYIDVQDETDEILSLNVEDYISSILDLYEYWLYDTSCNISISYFKTYFDYILRNKLTVCNYTSCMGKWLCVRPDGTITSCNRYMPREYDYGNVFDYSDIHEAFESTGFQKLLEGAVERRTKCISSCDIYSFCNGGCNNVAFNENGIENIGGFSCQARKAIYQHICSSVDSLCHKSIDYLNDNINPYVVKMIITSNKYKEMNGL